MYAVVGVCGAVQCSVVWCSAVQCGVVQCGAVWCGAVWCGAVRCGAVRCGVLQPHVLCCGGRVDCDVTLSTTIGVHDSLGLPATLEEEIITMATIH